ncbi:hypothetical protein KY308_02825 [Candidatus Woesearchaeota archaeon]|nr:hypothetical protein [Candidatus Woesearchaeota archaeon]
MAELKKILELRSILLKDSERRYEVIESLYTSLKNGFTTRTIEKLKPFSSVILNVLSEISKARDKIKTLGVSDRMFNSAMEILEQEYETLGKIYDSYFKKAGFLDVTPEWVSENIEVDKLKSLSIALNELKIKEKVLSDTINESLSQIEKEKRKALQRFG